MSANVQSMMYTGETPWHGFGKRVENALTSADAIAAAGMNWTVEKKQLFLEGGIQVPGAYATVRKDNNAILGTVGEQYTILQNREAFSFFDAIVGVKEAIYHTAGALGAGEKVWLLAKLPGYVRVKGDDITEKYLLLSNSHNGTSAVSIMFTPIRVVCQNTLNVAVTGADNKVHVRHTSNMGMRVAAVREALGIANQKFAMFEQAAQAMTMVQMTKEAFENYVKKSGLIPDGEKMSSRAQNMMDEVSGLFENGMGTDLPGVRGTMWGAFNAVTEFVDHHRGKDETRTDALLFGYGAKMKQKAWDLSLAAVKP